MGFGLHDKILNRRPFDTGLNGAGGAWGGLLASQKSDLENIPNMWRGCSYSALFDFLYKGIVKSK